jgi:hypothetical protein
MKFLIHRTSRQGELPGAFWDKKLERWAIRVRGLPSLLDLIRKVEHPIIIVVPESGDTPSIEIYDDYRE